MNIISGNININDFFSKTESYLISTIEFKNHDDFASRDRMKVKSIEILLESPIIIYVNNKTILSNVSIENPIHFLNNIIYIEDVITLIYLYYNLTQKEKMQGEFNCIFIESTVAIKKTRVLKNIVFLDYFLLRKDKKILKSGRIDYSKLEKMATELFSNRDIKTIIKKGKYFYQSALGLSLSDNKVNYVYQSKKDKFLGQICDIDISKYQDEKIYGFKCPICLNTHNILIVNIKERKRNIGRFIEVNSAQNGYEFVCNHEGTKYEKNGVNFKIKKDKYKVEKLTIEDKIKIFLYIFYTYYSEDGVIYSKDDSDKSSTINVSEYIDLLLR